MKQVFTNTTLTCSLQTDSTVSDKKSLLGVLTTNTVGFRFEEVVKARKPHTRNPKIFDGQFVSLVRKENNTVQFSFKTTREDFDPAVFPHKVCLELINAIKMIQP